MSNEFLEQLENMKELQEDKQSSSIIQNIDELEPPKTMKDLLWQLYEMGVEWREAHITTDKNNNEKVHPVSPRAVANILKKVVHFAVVTDDDPEKAPLCAYDLDEGIYKRGERFIGKLILAVEPTINKAGRANIIGWLEIESPEKEPTRDENLIVMKNGIFNRKTMKLMPFTPNYVFLTKVAVNYNPLAVEPTFPDWKFSDWLEELSDGDSEKLELFWRIIYACLNSNYISQKVVFLYSKKSKTGKGTFQQLLRNLVGKKDTAALRLRQLEERWGVYNAYGKALIIGDDNHPREYIERSENLKSIAVGEHIMAEGKGKDGFYVNITAQLVQSFNGLPRMSLDDGLRHRFILVHFTHTYQNSENKLVKHEYMADKQLLEWIACKVVHMKEVEMYNTKESKEILDEFEEENNSVLRFYNAFFGEFTSARLPVKFLFQLFQAWNREENNPLNMKQNSFTKELKAIAEEEGWEYVRKNLATLGFFHESDMRILDRFPITEYFTNNPKKYQPLFENAERYKKLKDEEENRQK